MFRRRHHPRRQGKNLAGSDARFERRAITLCLELGNTSLLGMVVERIELYLLKLESSAFSTACVSDRRLEHEPN